MRAHERGGREQEKESTCLKYRLNPQAGSRRGSGSDHSSTWHQSIRGKFNLPTRICHRARVSRRAGILFCHSDAPPRAPPVVELRSLREIYCNLCARKWLQSKSQKTSLNRRKKETVEGGERGCVCVCVWWEQCGLFCLPQAQSGHQETLDLQTAPGFYSESV